MKNTICNTSMFICMVLINIAFTKRITLQGLNKRSRTNHEVRDLSNASDGKGVMVTPGKPLTINFCLRVQSKVHLNNLRFSNFNTSALFRVSLDHGKWMGTYFAPPGDSYNKFINTGLFPKQHEFESGWHVLKINVSETSSPIALDQIEFDVFDDYITENILNCETICIPDGNFPVKNLQLTARATMGTILQRSEPTKCAEVDNINIALFHPYISEFSITASLPQYQSFSNRKDEDLSNCPHLSHIVWTFNHFRPQPGMQVLRDKDSSLLVTNGNGQERKGKHIVVLFYLEGLSKGSIDSRIGSHLFLRFKSLNSRTLVNLKYREANGSMTESVEKVYDSSALEHMWEIPDFTWREHVENYLILSVESQSNEDFEIDELRMEKRPMVADTVETIYRSDDVIIEAVFVEFWWLAPESMTVTLTNGKKTKNVAYIRFYRPLPWNGGYAQVFVLYQDGNIRLLPVAPEGVDWIPFGTSVIVGQPRTDSNRPYVNIQEVVIDPERWQMGLLYKDGSSCRMKINCTYSETQLFVNDLYFTKDAFTNPFLTIRSMFVSEGNNDVDSIKIDNKHSRHIMDNFGSIQGRSFSFFRRCISKHLTLSPDIQVDIARTSFRPTFVPLAHRHFARQVRRMMERSQIKTTKSDFQTWL
ncbi:uncharacterized protein LOC134696045 [Mytilus trossulus]|uniref:uncharacterized protein LOC134696045 n=1 Tax=Mytilus trossulus TaxID=6551 RepID=UPI00300657D8